MGMYDCVNFSMECPECGKPVFGFQSKDLGCNIDTLEPDDVDNFYSSCDSCGTWIEFYRGHARVDPRKTALTLSEVTALGFDMKVRVRPKSPPDPEPTAHKPPEA